MFLSMCAYGEVHHFVIAHLFCFLCCCFFLCFIFFIMLSVNFICNISSYDILAYITKNYIALIYYAKILHLLCQFHAGRLGFQLSVKLCIASPRASGRIQSVNLPQSSKRFLILVIVVNYISNFKNLYIFKTLNEAKNIFTRSRLSDPIYQSPISGPPLL